MRSSLRTCFLRTNSIFTPFASASASARYCVSNTFTQGFCKFGVVEDAYPVLVQIMRHPTRVTQGLQTARDDNAIIAAQHSIQLISIAFRKQFVHGSTPVCSGRLSILTTFCYNMHEGKSPLGKPRAYPVSLASGEPHLVRLSLFGFGLSQVGIGDGFYPK